jgi:hypothetical protein
VSGAEHVVSHPRPLDFDFWYAIRANGSGWVSAMSVDEPDGRLAAPSPLQVRRRAYEAVQAVVSDDHNYERGVEGARAVAEAAHAEFGAVGLAAVKAGSTVDCKAVARRRAPPPQIVHVPAAAARAPPAALCADASATLAPAAGTSRAASTRGRGRSGPCRSPWHKIRVGDVLAGHSHESIRSAAPLKRITPSFQVGGATSACVGPLAGSTSTSSR